MRCGTCELHDIEVKQRIIHGEYVPTEICSGCGHREESCDCEDEDEDENSEEHNDRLFQTNLRALRQKKMDKRTQEDTSGEDEFNDSYR